MNVTILLSEVSSGVDGATARLMEAVYDELRQLASAKMNKERPGHTLQSTALAHEAFLRLVGSETRLEDRAHFFGAAARAMERVLVDHARARSAQKRGGAAARVTLHDVCSNQYANAFDVLELREVVEKLERESEELAMIVRYRYFLGLSLEDTAALLGVSLATLKRRWTFARAWLYDHLGDCTEIDDDTGTPADA